MKIIISFLLILTLCSCFEQECNCVQFKTGTFQFSQTIDGKKHTSTFVRSKTQQIETYNGKTDTATVRWVNDCEFILQKIHPKNMQEQKAISMKIISTNRNKYDFEFGFINDSKKQIGSVIKIK